jgi:hypothetical protein
MGMSSQTPPSTPSAPMKRSKAHISSSTILLLMLTNGVSFMAGTFYGSNATISSHFPQRQLPNQEACPPPSCQSCPDSIVEKNIEENCPECPECPIPAEMTSAQRRDAARQGANGGYIFPSIVSRIAVGMAHTTKENFTKAFDLGFPSDPPRMEGDSGVLIIYSSPKAMPSRTGGDHLKLLSAEEATENCDHMNVITTYHEGKRRQ